jgi:hypothetical protein
MKTLYESILDDEESLIGNSIKDTQNPFRLLKVKSDELKSKQQWKEVADKIMSKITLPKKVCYYIGDKYIKLFIASSFVKTVEPSNTLIQISFNYYMLQKNDCCLLIDSTTKPNGKVKFDPDIVKFIKSFIEKYEFKHKNTHAGKVQNLYYLEK